MAGDRQVFGHHFMIQRVRTGGVNKLLAFGGDFLYPDLSYAHAKIARRACAEVLAAKVEDGFCQEEEAVELGSGCSSITWRAYSFRERSSKAKAGRIEPLQRRTM